jgi:hypothetical protein
MRRNDISVTAPDRAGLFLLDIKTVLQSMYTSGLQYHLNVEYKRRAIYAFVRLVDRYLIRESKLDRTTRFSELESKIGADTWQRMGNQMKQAHQVSPVHSAWHVNVQRDLEPPQ